MLPQPRRYGRGGPGPTAPRATRCRPATFGPMGSRASPTQGAPAPTVDIFQLVVDVSQILGAAIGVIALIVACGPVPVRDGTSRRNDAPSTSWTCCAGSTSSSTAAGAP